MRKFEKRWIVEVWDNNTGHNEYLVTFGTKFVPMLSMTRGKARATTEEIAKQSADMIAKQTGKLARAILK